MKIGRKSSSARRSTPYGTDPLRAQIMSDYAKSVEQFAPIMGVENYENNILPKTSYKVDEDENENKEVSGNNIIDTLNQLGWKTDFTFHPEEYANAGERIDKYEDLRQFLPDSMVNAIAAKDKAKKQAEKSLPANATQKQVDQLAKAIYEADLYEKEKNGANTSSNNVLQQVEDEQRDMLAYRIMTDPYIRAMEIGWRDQDGELQPGRLSLMADAIEEQLKERARLTKGYMNSALAVQNAGSYGIDVMRAMQAIGADDRGLFTEPENLSDSFKNPKYVQPENSPYELPEKSYMRDVLPSFLQGRKEVRIQNFQGKMLRGKEFSSMADNVSRALDLQEIIENFDNAINTTQDPEKKYDLIQMRKQAVDELQSVENFKDLLASYESAAFIELGEGRDNKKLIRPRNISQKLQGLLDKIGASTDLGIHHELTGYSELLDKLREIERRGYTPGSEDDLRARQLRKDIKKILESYKNLISEKQKQWSESAQEETNDLNWLKEHMPVSDVFQANVELSQKDMKMSDPRTLMFAMPQQLGSSNASIILSLGSMAVKLGAAVSGNPYAIAAAIPVGSQMNISNAAWENNAEVAEGYRRKVEKALQKEGLYNDVLNEIRARIPEARNEKPEDIMRHVYNGEIEINNIKANRVIADAVFGADLTYQYDMGETARSSYKESMVELLPAGVIAKAGKFVLAPVSKAGDKVLRGISKGLYNTANYAKNLAGKGDLVVNVDKMNKYLAQAAAFAASVPKSILMGESYLTNAIGFGVRTQLNMLGEGIEEGVQHVHQNRFATGEYDNSMNMGLFKPIAEDIILGGRLGLEWITGNDYGSGYSSDQQMFAEMRGGALGALFQSTPITSVMQGKKLVSEINAIDIAVDQAIREKLSQRDTIEKAKQFVKNISNARYEDVVNKLDKFARLNALRTKAAKTLGTDDYGIAEEFLDQTKELYNTVAMYANNKALNKLYKENGIEPGDDKYNERIAIIVDQDMRVKDSFNEMQNSDAETARVQNEARTKDQNQQILLQLNRDEDYGNPNVQQTDFERQERAARLKAALQIINEYNQLEQQRQAENKPVYKSTIKKYAEKVVKEINEELNTSVKNLEDFMNTFGVVDDDIVKAHRQNLSVHAEFDAAKNILNRLLSPNTAIKTVNKLVSSYNDAIKKDEELQQRIHDDYVSQLEKDEQIEEMLKAIRDEEERQSVAPQTRVLNLGEDKKKTVTVTDRTREEQQNYIEDAMSPYDPTASMYDTTESADLGSREAIETNTVDSSEEDDYKNTPVSNEQAERLFDDFIDNVSAETPLNNLRGRISRRASGLIKHGLRGKVDAFGRSIAQRISLLHNNGYSFRESNGNYYAVKNNAVIRLTKTEMMFGRYLNERYGTEPIMRQEYEESVTTDIELPESTAPIPTEPEPREYEPNEDQLRIKQELEQKAENDKNTLVSRNAHDYIFNINGKLVIYTRLHAEIGSQEEDSPAQQAIKNTYAEMLRSVWEDKHAFEKLVKFLEDRYNKALGKKYGESSETFKHNKLNLSVYLHKDLINNQQIIESISDLLKSYAMNEDESKEEISVVTGPWAMAGNIMDEMYRQVLGGNDLSYTDVLVIDGSSVIISQVMDAAVFDSIMNQLNQFKKWFRDNQIVPVTDRILLHAQLKSGHMVAGETDMIGIDRNGNLIIFDFKTSQFPFDDRYDTVQPGKKWSTKRQHSRQVTGYNNLILQEFQNRYNVSDMFIIPIVVKYNQQNGVFTKFTDSQQQMGIRMTLDSSLNSQMNSSVTLKNVKDTFDALKEGIQQWAETVRVQYPKLSEHLRMSITNFKRNIDAFEDRVSRIEPNSQIDIDTATEQLQELFEEFERISAESDQQIQLLIEAGVDFTASQQQQANNHPLGPNSSQEERDEFDEQMDVLIQGQQEQIDFGDTFMPDMDDEYLQNLEQQMKPQPKKRGGERGLEEIAADMEAHNQRGGKLTGSLPGEQPSGVQNGPAAPIQAKSASIQDAPDYSNQTPVEFSPKIKTEPGGYKQFNIAHRDTVNGQLAEDCADPDFSEKATFVIDTSTLVGGHTDKWGNPIGLDGDFIYASVLWKGKTYLVKFEWATLGDAGNRVREKLRSLYNQNPNAKIIVSKISRTNGQFKWGEDKNLLDSPFIQDENELLDILESGHLGISSQQEYTPGLTMPQINTLSRTSSAPLYPFRPGFSIVPGILTWVYKFQQSEKQPGDVNLVPIPLTPKRLQKDDIDLIVDILQHNRKQSAKEYRRNIKVGRRNVKSPLTDWQILNLLIYFGQQTREINKGSNFVFDWVRGEDGSVDASRIEISGIGTDRGTLYTVDLANPNDVEKFKQRLRVSGFVHVNNETMLKYSLDGNVDNSESNPFKSVSNFFKVSENESIKSIKISESLVFDRKDFDFHEDGSNVALSGAGWAIRHGWVTTQFVKLRNARISIEDVDYDNQQPVNKEEQKKDPVEKSNEPTSTAELVGQSVDWESQNDMMNMMGMSFMNQSQDPDEINSPYPFRVQRQQSTTPIDKEKAIKRIKRMLGKHFKVNIIDGAVAVFEQGKAWAVGACKKDSIILSTLAEAGTEYHETFHHVMELLFSPSARRKLHQHYIKRYNGGEEMSERATGERLSEMFMQFINNLPDVYLSWNVLKTFSQIKDWVNAWRNLDDYTLAKTFFYAYSGLAKFNWVSKASSENFDRIFGDAAYSTINVAGNDINFKNFANGVHLRDGIKFATFLILQGYNIDSLGQNLANLDIRLNTLKQKSWYNVAIGEGKENPSLLQKQLKEIFDHWGSTQKMVVDELERIGIGGKIDANDKKDEDKQSGDLSNISQDIDGHLDEFYKFDKKLDLDSSLKILLSTIPNMRYSTRDDLMWETNERGQFIDSNGKVTKDPKKRVRRTAKLSDGRIVPVGMVDSLTVERKNADGTTRVERTIVPISTNSLGVAEFMDFDTTYSLLISNLQDCYDVNDMINRLYSLSSESPLYKYIADKLSQWNKDSIIKYDSGKEVAMIGDMRLSEDDYMIVTDDYGQKHIVYSHDTDEGKYGHIIKNAYLLTNPDKESLVTRMFQSFKSQRLKFIFVYANHVKDSRGNNTDYFTYENKATNSTASTRIYPRQWFDNLRYGATNIFEVIGDSIRVKKGGEKIISKIVEDFSLLMYQMFKPNNPIIQLKSEGKTYELDKNLPEDVDFIESWFIARLNMLGIDINKSVLDYYISKQYFGMDKGAAFTELLSSRSKESSFQSFLSMLSQLQDIIDSGDYTKLLTDTKASAFRKIPASGMYIFSENAFVKELGTAYGSYSLATNEFMTLGPENTKMYTMAQNHTASEFTEDFNRAVVDKDGNVKGSKILDDMKKFCYNFFITKNGTQIGSQVIKHLHQFAHRPLSLETLIGVKKDDYHDGGTKYAKVSKRDDFLAKVRILQNGGIIFPTLADKSTWFYLTGVRLKGLDYGVSSIDGALPIFSGKTGRMAFGLDAVGKYKPNEVLDQLREYAECERAAVVKAINELETLQENAKKERNPGRKLELQKQIENYHTKNQATRFAFLIGVYSESEKSKNYKYKKNESFISFNFDKKLEDGKWVPATLRDCLDQADKYYYSKTAEQQRSMLANILQHRLDEQLEWAVKAGIIEKSNNTAVAYGQYRNKLLDHKVIEHLKTRYKNMDVGGVALGNLNGITNEVIESFAVVAYLNDINAKSIQSIEEVCRLYTGAPHFFKWKYGADGTLQDLRSDLAKRLGGLGSTGDSNRLDLPNIPREYNCAEIEDELVKSELYEAYKEGFLDNEYRIAVFDQEINKIHNRLQNMPEEQRQIERKRIWDDIQAKPLEDVIKMADKRIKGIVEANAAAETKSFESKINVADGTAYITPQMCLNLLRQRGVYTGNVKQAFQHLMGMDAGSDMLSNHTAYKTIFDALISTQKYSAYGYRMEGDIVVHFYDKFALFPLFKSMAYGFTHDMLEKMEDPDNPVDMVMFESAVKSGSEGKQKFTKDTFRQSDDQDDEENWNHDSDGNRTSMKPDIKDFKFNVYKQEYKFIRRQLNTDPREEEKMHIGTQMLKIALANLFKEAVYKTPRGEVDGNQLRDDIMSCIKKLSDIGIQTLKDELMTNDKIDIKKLSTFLKSELSKRNADPNTLEGLDVIGDGDNARFVTPLEAMSNIEWIESIIISKINKEAIDINLPGNAYYQRSVFGMEGSPIRVVSDDAMNKIDDKLTLKNMLAKAKKQFMIYSGRSLKAINNDGSMDCIISIDYFLNQKGLIPKEIRGNYWAVRNYLKKNNIIGKNAKAIMIGYRIPTQAESSVHALRVVDVLPVVRDTIVLPKDFTKTTGSDFDIDKLYLTSYNFNVTDSGISTETFEESDPRYWQNRLLDNYMALLKDGGSVDEDGNYKKGRTLQFLHRSIDNDTLLAKGSSNSVYERIVGNVKQRREEPFQYQSLATQVDIKSQFVGGKFNVGPFALANNAQIFTMLYDVEFNDSENGIMSQLGAKSLHERTDKNGNSVMAWISAMINGAVDAAKDPWEAELNVNPYTYGIINMLLRTGMGDQTFMFINQPIIREAADAFILSDGVIIEDSGKSKTRRQEDAVQSRIHYYLDSLGENYKTLLKTILSEGRVGSANDLFAAKAQIVQVAKQLFGVEDGLYTNEFYTWNDKTQTRSKNPVKGKSILEDIITNPDVRINRDEPISMDNISDAPYYSMMLDGEWMEFSAKEIQLYVIGAMYEFRPFIQALEDTVSYTKIDTKKHGGSWAEQMDYKENFNTLYVSENGDGMFNENINSMLDDSFIAHKTNNAINFLNDILEDRAVQYKKGFQMAVSHVQKLISNYTQEGRVRIQRMLLGGLKNDFIQQYIIDNNIDQKGLFVGPNSIQRRLARISILVKSDMSGKYSEYASNGVITNPLLASLESVPYARTADQPMFVKMKRAMVDDPQMAKDITYAWRDMLNDDNEEFKLFARDLIVYAMLTSNDTPGFTKFFKYVPKEWKELSGYNEYMTRYKKMDDMQLASLLQSRVPTWLKQNWFDNILVPIQKYTDSNSSNGITFFGHHVNTDNPIIKGSNILSIMGAAYFRQTSKQMFGSGYWTTSIKDDSAPLYIKIFRKNALSTDPDNMLVYELVGHGTKVVGKNSITYPIYKLIVPPGAYINTSANSNFSIYTNETFEHPIEGIVSHTMEYFDKRVDEVVTWLQNNAGDVYESSEFARSIAQQFGVGYRNLIYESAVRKKAEAETSVRAEDLFEEDDFVVISGGQSGVDSIALYVANKLGIKTKGTAPKNFQRENIDYWDDFDIAKYGLTEISDEEQALYTSRTGKSDAYTARTDLNVRNSDGTIYFHSNEDNSGFLATKRSAEYYNKPFLENPTVEQIVQFVRDNNIHVLNVAGNRASKLKNHQSVVATLQQAFDKIKQENSASEDPAIQKARQEGNEIKNTCKNQG